MPSPELTEELAALDADEQREFLEAANAGEDYDATHERVLNKYRERYLDIVNRHQTAPVFRLPFPAPHAPAPVS
jgi:hypothetical protein